MEVVEKIVDGRWPDIKPPIKQRARDFVDVIRDLRKHAHKVSMTRLQLNAQLIQFRKRPLLNYSSDS
jgi:hypothetical protein